MKPQGPGYETQLPRVCLVKTQPCRLRLEPRLGSPPPRCDRGTDPRGRPPVGQRELTLGCQGELAGPRLCTVCYSCDHTSFLLVSVGLASLFFSLSFSAFV